MRLRLKLATIIRAEISEKNKYWISKHRHYELKHFCLQYPYWKQAYNDISYFNGISSISEQLFNGNNPSDKTATQAMMKAYYSKRIKMVEEIALEVDEFLYSYILKAVTEGVSYTYLKTVMNIPCSRDIYYMKYRKFFGYLVNREIN